PILQEHALREGRRTARDERLGRRRWVLLREPFVVACELVDDHLAAPENLARRQAVEHRELALVVRRTEVWWRFGLVLRQHVPRKEDRDERSLAALRLLPPGVERIRQAVGRRLDDDRRPWRIGHRRQERAEGALGIGVVRKLREVEEVNRLAAARLLAG